VARHPRGHLPAGTYHVTTRSAGPTAVFTDDDECKYFCELVRSTAEKHDWAVRAFCVMSTHYHLLLDVREESLQTGMQRLNWSYARWFNARTSRSGHLFGERYYCDLIETDGHMLSAMRYIARNPVKAGLCSIPADWRWSSYRRLVGVDDSFPFVDAEPLRAYFGSDRASATVQIRRFVDYE
jgi:REP element-mobilizing transposase RayT